VIEKIDDEQKKVIRYFLSKLLKKWAMRKTKGRQVFFTVTWLQNRR